MLRIPLLFAAALAACTPSPQEAVMRSASPGPGTAAPRSEKGQGSGASARPDAGDRTRAAQGPIPASVSAAENPAPAPAPAPAMTTALPAAALGRRILSTAFVRVGPDGQLTVELRDGRVLVLRDVVMRAKDYCGVRVSGGKSGARHCGGYADVAAARPGGATPAEPPGPGIAGPIGGGSRVDE